MGCGSDFGEGSPMELGPSTSARVLGRWGGGPGGCKLRLKGFSVFVVCLVCWTHVSLLHFFVFFLVFGFDASRFSKGAPEQKKRSFRHLGGPGSSGAFLSSATGFLGTN